MNHKTMCEGTTKGPQRGSLEEPSMMNGRRPARSCGPMGNGWLSLLLPPTRLAYVFSFAAGSGKSFLW